MNAATVTELKPAGTAQASTAPHVLQAISAVMADVAKEGIGKGRKNETQGYKFRGIDDVYNALAPILSRNNLVITPRCSHREKEVVTTKNGGTLFYVTVDMEFELASALDGSTKIARMFGEAMDSGDKATNKAMSAAYKYMAMQQFCIPTEGDNDADATNHQLATAEQQAIAHVRSCAVDKATFTTAWESNKASWKNLLSPDAYARVVAVMKEEGAKLATKPEPKPAPPPAEANPFDISDDEIPF